MSDQTTTTTATEPAVTYSADEIAAALHAGQTDENAPAFLASLNAEQRAALVDAHRLADLADDPICQTFAALSMMLAERAESVAASMIDTSAIDAQLSALRAIPGSDTGPIAAAILQTERDRDLTRKSAVDTATAANRKRYGAFLDELAAYGRPVAPAPVGKSTGRKTTTSGPTPLVDADGNTYVKHDLSRDTYAESGKTACGQCPISTVAAQAGTVAVANLRQNATHALAKMTRAEVIAHADCFAALRDAEYNDVRAAMIRLNYVIAE